MQNQECIEKINTLIEKYKSDEYMTNRLYNHIINQIEPMLDNIHKQHQIKVDKKTSIEKERQDFIDTYLIDKFIYYIPSNDIFVKYDSHNYNVYKEDDIQHDILSLISKNNLLSTCKHQLKNNIIKIIKANHFSETIPESNTIQDTLNYFYPNIFCTKDECKYFLCIIGDNILKKNENISHFIKPSAKTFLSFLSNQIFTFIGNNIALSSFKYKYQDHIYKNCRIIKTNAINNTWSININILNVLSVAYHYSNRYGNSDNFIINKCNDLTFKNKVLFIQDKTPSTIVDIFINEFIEETDINNNISWKNMQYLWKLFIKKFEIPNIIFSSNFKKILVDKFNTIYSNENDSFNNITSKYLPLISLFNEFWIKYIIEDDTEYELEIDELTTLFSNTVGSQKNINDKFVINLINHFYQDIIIEDNKYILNVKCTLWDKQSDIIFALDSFKAEQIDTGNNSNISIYKLYDYYCKLLQNNQYIVSKRYFDKFIYSYLSDYINSNIILSSWWSTSCS